MATIAEIKAQYPDLGDLNDDQVVDALHQAFYQDMPRDQVASALGIKPIAAPAKMPERSWLGLANDSAINMANSAVGLVKSGVDLVAPDSVVSGAMSDFIKSGKDKQSDKQKFLDAQLADKLKQDAENDGSTSGQVMSQLKQAGTYIGHGLTSDPGKLVSETAGNLVPFLGMGKAMQAAKLGTGARTAVSGGLSGGLSAGEVRGNIWDKISGTPDADLMQQSPEYAQLRQAGASELDAKRELGANIMRNLPEIAAVGAVGAATGKYGVEGMASGVFPKMGRVAAGVVGGIDEGVVQGGTEQLASNYGVQRAMPSQSLTEGLGLNMAAEGMPGVAMGVASGGSHAPAPFNAAQPPSQPLEQVPPGAPTLQIGNAPDPLISFPDGTVARRSEIDKYVSGLPPDQQPAMRARMMGLAPQPSPADQLRATKVPESGPMTVAVNAGIESQAQDVESGKAPVIDLAMAQEADQAAYEQAMAQEQELANQQDSIDKPVTSGAIAEAQMSEEDKRAILFSNQPVLDGGAKFKGTQDGDVLNGLGEPFKTKFAAIRRANMEGKDWTISAVEGGWVARRKDAAVDAGKAIQPAANQAIQDVVTEPPAHQVEATNAPQINNQPVQANEQNPAPPAPAEAQATPDQTGTTAREPDTSVAGVPAASGVDAMEGGGVAAPQVAEDASQTPVSSTNQGERNGNESTQASQAAETLLKPAQDSQPTESKDVTQAPEAVQEKPQAPRSKAAAKPKKLTPNQRIAESLKARADYFAPGNIVKGYSGYDRVISYKPPSGNGDGWSVTVQSVVKQDGRWVVDPNDKRERIHSTQPDKREMSGGPVERVAAESVAATEEPAQPTAQTSYAINDAIRTLRSKAHNNAPKTGPRGDVRMSSHHKGANFGEWVSFEDAVAEARKAVSSGVRPVPFQIHNALDVNIGDTDRIIAALAQPASEVTEPSAKSKPAAQEPIKAGDNILSIPMMGRGIGSDAMSTLDLGKPVWEATDDDLVKAVQDSGTYLGKPGSKYDPYREWREGHAKAIDQAVKDGRKLTDEVLYDKPELIRGDLNDDQADEASDVMVDVYRATKDYIKAVQAYRDFGKAQPAAQEPVKAAKIEDIGEKIGGARKDTAVSTGPKSAAPAEMDDRSTWEKRFSIGQVAGGFDMSVNGQDITGKWTITDTREKRSFGGSRALGGYFNSKDEAEAALPVVAVAMKHSVTTAREYDANGNLLYEIWRKVSDSKRVKVVNKQFQTRNEAMEYMAKHAREILETNTTFGEADLPKPESTVRTGVDRRTGDVEGKDFQDAFGFRGVEFGNWNNQTERQEVMNAAYDGLMDLADVLGIPPKAIGLNGDLALAFGARGQGLSSARAHYERSRVVMNLTKMNGAGALAHEWFHALDHYLGRQDGKASSTWKINPDGTRSLETKGAEADMASSGFRSQTSGVRQELRDAYKTLIQTLFYKAEQYVEDTAKADKFVGVTRGELEKELQTLRKELSSERTWGKRNNKPASAEQLAEFDAVAAALVEGRGLETEWKTMPGNGPSSKLRPSIISRYTNESLEKISDIFKAVRGRSGFNSERTGVSDNLRGYISRYDQRLKMLAAANNSETKTKNVPTSFAMDAKSLDQGRGGDYWTTPHEMAARAFQGYVEDMISAKDGNSPFLNYAPENVGVITPWGAKRPYPAGAERKAMNSAFDAFVRTVQTKETDKGVAMFSTRTSSPEQQLPLTQIERLVQSALRGMQNAPIVRVVASPEAIGLTAPVDTVPSGVTLANGDIYVFQSGIGSVLDVDMVVFHELFHKGLQNVMPKADYVAAMLNIAKIDAKVREYAGKWSDSKAAKAQMEELAKTYSGQQLADHYEALAIEEGLAMIAEDLKAKRQMGTKDFSVRRFSEWLAKLADKIGMTRLANSIRSMSYSEAEKFVISTIGKAGGAAGGNAKFSAGDAAQTDTAAFKKWFGDSKVVDAQGKPLVVYHGTAGDFNTFDPKKVGSNYKQDKKGFFFVANPKEAGWAADDASEKGGAANIMPLYIKISNPLKIVVPQGKGFSASAYFDNSNKKGILAQAKKENRDGIIVQGRGDDVMFIAFSPEQIKSAKGNNGNFDAANPDIRFRAADTVSGYTKHATDKLNEAFNHPGTMSLWHKTVGSMYDLAERSPPFKRVFDAAQSFIRDVSFYATEAADLAPKILPKLDTWKDMLKTPVSAADNKAISAPILQGTLSWARDESGKAVRVETLEAAAKKMTIDQKSQRLLRGEHISESVMKMWRGLPVDQYEAMIESKYESSMLKPGLVFTDAELVQHFNLTPDQIKLYKEFRAATDKSLDNLAKADLLRFGGKDVAPLRDMVMDAATVDDAAVMLRDYLHSQRDLMPERVDDLISAADGMIERADKVNKLKKEGYAPLSRFGRYSVDVVVDGERQYFSLFESKRAANLMAIKLKAEFGADNVAQGTMSQKEFEQFQGITPESLELFGNMLGLDSTGDEAQDKAFQTYLKLTKTNRSAMRRMIHRQGVAGYSEDMGRVLAAFVYSNARQTSAALHMGELGESVNDIPKGQGELKDAAIELSDYIKKPREEAQALRGLLFAQFLGGSVASAFVNFTQPLTVSFPYLSQFGGATKAGAALMKAMQDQKQGKVLESGLAQALKKAEEDGVVSPQSVHELMAQAQGRSTLNSGDGTRLGDAKAFTQNNFSKLALGWGKLFGLAEQINRRSTFIAAYRIAVDQKITNPGAFATKAVNETQFISNKANKAKFGRGAIGATLMTFKSYSINYLELLHRMATRNGPEGKKAAALMLGMLFLMAGAGGLPFDDDLEDLADFIGQRLGYNFSSKKAKQEFLEGLFGKAMADFIDKGITGLPGSPIDTSGRMSMGNLIPGTGLLLKKRDHTGDLKELAGPVGDLIQRGFQGADKLLSGDVVGAAKAVAPKAVYNALKGKDMAESGAYNDDKGYKVIESTPFEAAMKAIGFQPASVADVQQSNYLNQRAKDFYSLSSQDINARWAKGIYEKDPEQISKAREMIQNWNDNNPDQRMKPNMPAILKRVREMRKDKAQRIADTAPKAMRAQMKRELATAG